MKLYILLHDDLVTFLCCSIRHLGKVESLVDQLSRHAQIQAPVKNI